jgi:hypothetical protein
MPARTSRPSGCTASIGRGAADRPRGPVEAREEAVAGCVQLAAPEASQFSPDGVVVSLEHPAPQAVAELAG